MRKKTRIQSGEEWHTPDGNIPMQESGSKMDFPDGIKIGGTALDRSAAQINLLAQGVAAGYKIARGRHTTVAASDTVVTGLATVVAVIATLESDPVDDPFMVSASIGDQAGTPAAGSVLIKTWKNTGGTDPTPAAATTFSKVVNWIAVGT
jgi:hypothetical protein